MIRYEYDYVLEHYITALTLDCTGQLLKVFKKCQMFNYHVLLLLMFYSMGIYKYE